MGLGSSGAEHFLGKEDVEGSNPSPGSSAREILGALVELDGEITIKLEPCKQCAELKDQLRRLMAAYNRIDDYNDELLKKLKDAGVAQR